MRLLWVDDTALVLKSQVLSLWIIVLIEAFR